MNELEQKSGGFWEILKVIIVSLAIVLPIRYFIAQPFVVEGPSMEPTFINGEYLIVDEVSYDFKKPARGDVIVFKYPLNPSEYFIKRIIGLPGETVEIKNDSISIMSPETKGPISINEPYIPASFKTMPDEIKTLKSDEYFVLGDNREHSSDSRFWGPLASKFITGRVLIRLWPVARASIF